MRSFSWRLSALLLLGFGSLAWAAPVREAARVSALHDVLEAAPTSAPTLLSLQGRLSRPTNLNDQVGACVAAAGDVNGDGVSDFLVGAPGNFGNVYVLAGKIDGPPVPFAQLSSNDANADLGWSVASAGDIDHDGYDDIVIGEPLYNGGSGRVWVYRGGPSSMPFDTTLDAPSPGEEFGATVAGAGDLNGDGYDDIVVGAPYYTSSPFTNQGAVYVFYGGPGGHLSPPVVLPGTVNNEDRGYAVAGVGDVDADGYDDIVVGGPHTSGSLVPGTIYFYRGSSTGVHLADSLSAIGSGSDAFGFSVASAGDYDGDGYGDIVVGAPYDGSQAGKAYLIHGTSTGISHTITTLLTGTQAAAFLGWSVGCAGDVNGDGLGDVVIGEPKYDGPLGADQGRLTLMYGNRGTSPFANVVLNGHSAGSAFGTSVSGIGDVNDDGFGDIAAGAPPEGGQGNYYVTSGAAAAPRTVSISYAPNNLNGLPTNSHGGTSVSISGDVNGDGYDDAVWGVPRGSYTVNAEGIVYFMEGSNATTFLNSLTATTLHNGQANSLYGQSCAIVGDVNGDGYDDAVVGAPGFTSSFAQEGAAYLYLGSSAGLDSNFAVRWLGGSAGLQWGSCVAGVGDLNHDGYADIAIGSTQSAINGARSGLVSVYLGGPGGPSTTSAFDLPGTATEDSLGFAIAAAGDINGDGYDDMIVGAPGASGATGKIVIVWGGPSPPFSTTTVTGTLGAGARFGYAVDGRADFNGDGWSDVAVGAPDALVGGLPMGEVLVLSGASGGLTGPTVLLQGTQAGARFGAAVAWGDLSDDGFSDLVVGSPLEDGVAVDYGAIRAFVADGAGGFAAPVAFVKTSASYSHRGSSLSANGDINGDGFADVLAGDPFSFSELGVVEQEAGGGAIADRERIVRQRRADETAPIGLEGKISSGPTVALHAHGRTAAGRRKVALESQIGPIASALLYLSPVSGPWTDSGVPDPTLGSFTELAQVTGPASTASNYHWRLRVKAHSPWFPHTPWLTPAGNASTLTDLADVTFGVAVGPTPTHGLAFLAVEPNPARGAVTFAFRLPSGGAVRLSIYDVQGRLVRHLDRAMLPAGAGSMTWDGADEHGRQAGSGIFFARLSAGPSVLSRRFVRL